MTRRFKIVLKRRNKESWLGKGKRKGITMAILFRQYLHVATEERTALIKLNLQSCLSCLLSDQTLPPSTQTKRGEFLNEHQA